MRVQVTGVLLAAGAGRRMGRPKALVEVGGEPLVLRAIRALQDGGCHPVHVVLGAANHEVGALLPTNVTAVTADDWREGMGASLRAGLAAAADADAVLVHLVDLPAVNADVIRAVTAEAERTAVVRASYHGKPGHPVLFGGDHLPSIAATLHGDAGARDWLAGRGDVRLVECAHLGDGIDVDTPQDLADGVTLGRWSTPR
jgi:nicotine blue oxidoreductase